jgi:hypothetical protein
MIRGAEGVAAAANHGRSSDEVDTDYTEIAAALKRIETALGGML